MAELAKHEWMYLGTDDEIKERIREQLAFRDKFNDLNAEVEAERSATGRRDSSQES